jgi:hypothetical protein
MSVGERILLKPPGAVTWRPVCSLHVRSLPALFQVTLSTNDPQSAIADIQQRGALQDPRCRPLLGLLDQLGLPRWAARVEC